MGRPDGGVLLVPDGSGVVGSPVTGAEVEGPADGSAVVGSVVTTHSVKSGPTVGWSVGSSSAMGSIGVVESSRVTSLSTSRARRRRDLDASRPSTWLVARARIRIIDEKRMMLQACNGSKGGEESGDCDDPNCGALGFFYLSLLYRSPPEDGCHVGSPKTPHNNVYRCLRERHGVCTKYALVACSLCV